MSTFQSLDTLLQGFVENGVPGCSVCVTQHGKTLFEGYYGYSDIESGKKVDENSLFRMASMSKIPLYTTMMMLYERGKFLLTDPISRWLPEYATSVKYVRSPNGYVTTAPTQRPINVSDVLSMKCGLPNLFPGETNNLTLRAMQKAIAPLNERGYYTNREHVAAMANVPLACEPGEKWIYGFSCELAAAIIEAVCDKGIDEVFQEFLFDPLEMESTRSRFTGNDKERLVTMYARHEDKTLTPMNSALDSKHEPGPENEMGWARLFSNVKDYSHLLSMLACGGEWNGRQIMGRKTIDMMRANGLAGEIGDSPYNAGYGYGYGVRTLITNAQGSNAGLGSFGWTGGFGTWCEADPSDGVGIVYMHNMAPNYEHYYHLRVRNTAYGCIE